MDEKLSLRNDMLVKRNALSKDEIEEKSLIITGKILETKEFEQADTIFTYLSMKSEVSTYALIEAMWKLNKNVALPFVDSMRRVMRFRLIEDLGNLQKSKIGVMEPTGGEELVPEPGKSLLIVPGLVFDLKRNRIGYGGGYYDKYISRHKDVFRMAICFEAQVMYEIVTEPHDMPMDMIVTEKDIY